MVNAEKFTKRLQKILDYYDLSAASFADGIKVNRSSISHILSGRNKPSLDFVLKVIFSYPEVDLYWLLNGKGSFPKQPVSENKKEEIPFTNELHKPIKKEITKEEKTTAERKVNKIILLYEDGTFEVHENH